MSDHDVNPDLVTGPSAEGEARPRALVLAEQLHSLLDEIAATSTADCSDAQLLAVVSEHERASRRMESIGVQDYVDTSDRGAYRASGYLTMHAFQTGVLNLSHGAAQRRRVQAANLGRLTNLQGELLEPTLPDTAQALAEGAISGARVDVVLDTMKRIPGSVDALTREVAEASMAHYARDFNPTTLRKLGIQILAHLDPDGSLTDERDRKRQRGLRLESQDFQLMSKLVGTLDPTTRAMLDVVLSVWGARGVNNPDDPQSPTGDPNAVDAKVLAAAAERDKRSAEQRKHDALTAVLRTIIDGGHLGESHHGLPPQIIVTVTEAALREAAGAPATTATGALLPIGEVVELAAKAQQHLVVFADHSAEVLYFGRSRRLASRAQRLAVIARDGSGCTRPNCTTPAFDAQVHHVTEFQHGGNTDINDLAVACGPDNRHVGTDDDKWTTTMQESGPDAGRPAWHPPAANPNQERIINHANLPVVVVQRVRNRLVKRRRAQQSERTRTPDGEPEGAMPSGPAE